MNKTAKAILTAIHKSNGCINAGILTYVTPYKFATAKRVATELISLGYVVNEPTCDGNACYYITEDGKFFL